MIVAINSRWRLRTDPHQWNLERRRKDEKRWDAEEYFRDIGNLFRVLVDKQVYELDLVLPPGALVPLHRALTGLKADIMAAVETLKDGRYPEADGGPAIPCAEPEQAGEPTAPV